MNEERPRPIRRSTAPDHISVVNNERIVFTAADRVVKGKPLWRCRESTNKRFREGL